MFMFLSKRIKREQSSPLNEAQRALVEKKFEILRQASFGFTHDRLLHIQEEDLKVWTDACTGELRREIASAAPSHIKIALIDFRKLRCVSLQCLSLWISPPSSPIPVQVRRGEAVTTLSPLNARAGRPHAEIWNPQADEKSPGATHHQPR